MRTYGGWAAADQTRFKDMMKNVFYPICSDFLVRHNGTEWTHYATSYNVKRATVSGAPYTTIQTGITDLLTYTDTTAPAGANHYVVTAITPSGETAVSNQATIITGTPLHTYLPFDASSGTLIGGASQNWIGRSQYADPYFNGKVDDFRIYRGALSAAEVLALHNS